MSKQDKANRVFYIVVASVVVLVGIASRLVIRGYEPGDFMLWLGLACLLAGVVLGGLAVYNSLARTPDSESDR